MKTNSKLGKSSVKQIEKEVVVKSKLKESEEEKKEKAWQALFAARGILKGKGKFETDEEFYKWRMENSEKFAKELAKKYGWKL